MRTIRHDDSGFGAAAAALARRFEPAADVREAVEEIVRGVRERGDAALIDFARKFDGAELSSDFLRVSDDEIESAISSLDGELREILAASHRNVLEFSRRGLRDGWRGVNEQGAEVGEVYHPFDRVGIYVPGGSAPLVSSAVMTVTLAAAAGVPEIAVCTPCGVDLSVHPALLGALRLAGATEVYRIGGAQAIAALAFGTESIRPVAKVFGPGNRFVVEAKRQVFGAVGVDLLPGPSEIAVLADETGDAACIAADLLAQAEHGADSVALFVTDSEDLLAAVQREVDSQRGGLSRQDQIRAVIEKGVTFVLVADLADGVAIVNGFAPEHLSLITAREEEILPRIRTAGAIFLGNDSPVAVGDFLAGPSHELPTGGAGKAFPGLTVDQFQRRTSIVRLDRAAMTKSAAIAEKFARAEGLDAHARSIAIRAERRD